MGIFLTRIGAIVWILLLSFESADVAVGAVATSYSVTVFPRTGIASSVAMTGEGGKYVGYANGPGFSNNAGHAVIFNGGSGPITDLTPTPQTSSFAYSISGNTQAGYFANATTGFNEHAALWNGTAASLLDLHPAGLESSLVEWVSGNVQVGHAQGVPTNHNHHAFLWKGTAASAVDLNPTGFTSSIANAAAGLVQIGGGFKTSAGQGHALRWSGTAASFLDIHPPGRSSSDAHFFMGNVIWGSTDDVEFTWDNNVTSVFDMRPSGYSVVYLLGGSGNTEVGYGSGNATGFINHALAWTGKSAASAVDLDAFLPPSLRGLGSVAEGIDEAGNIVGYVDSNSSQIAVMWSPTPEPAGVGMLAMSGAWLLGRRCNRRG